MPVMIVSSGCLGCDCEHSNYEGSLPKQSIKIFDYHWQCFDSDFDLRFYSTVLRSGTSDVYSVVYRQTICAGHIPADKESLLPLASDGYWIDGTPCHYFTRGKWRICKRAPKREVWGSGFRLEAKRYVTHIYLKEQEFILHMTSMLFRSGTLKSLIPVYLSRNVSALQEI